MHEADPKRGNHGDDRRAEGVVETAQICDHDPGKRSVGDAVADERKLTQDDVGAHRRAESADDQRRDERALHEFKRKGSCQDVHYGVVRVWPCVCVCSRIAA